MSNIWGDAYTVRFRPATEKALHDEKERRRWPMAQVIREIVDDWVRKQNVAKSDDEVGREALGS